MDNLQNVSIIIPSLDPDERLKGVVSSLIAEGFSDIILVDDGSKAENKCNFPQGDGITLLVHEVNKGKGAALKTALKYLLENRKDSRGAVTCDGDGQHLAKDVKRVCKEMLKTDCYVLGVRDFSLPDVPKKSMVGNRVSAFALALVSGVKVSDTQTGLRAIPKKLFKAMYEVKGDRFEYETNVLLELKGMKAKCSQVTIETVYLDENKGSHYRPFWDSLRIASLILKYLASSVLSFVVDIAFFTVFNSVLLLGIPLSTVFARIISSVFNFFTNRKVVFECHSGILSSIVKYYILAIPVAVISLFGVKGIAFALNLNSSDTIVTLIKIIVDFILFLVNFRLQKFWVFSKNNTEK